MSEPKQSRAPPKKVTPRERIASFLRTRAPLKAGAPGGIPRRVRAMLRKKIAPHRPKMILPSASPHVLGEHLLRIGVDMMALAQRSTMNGTSLRPSLEFVVWLVGAEPAFNGRPAVDPGPWALADVD